MQRLQDLTPPQRRRLLAAAGIAAGLLVLVVVFATVVLAGGDDDDPDVAATATPTGTSGKTGQAAQSEGNRVRFTCGDGTTFEAVFPAPPEDDHATLTLDGESTDLERVDPEGPLNYSGDGLELRVRGLEATLLEDGETRYEACEGEAVRSG